MLKKILMLAVALLISSSCFAAKIDSANFNKALKQYADCISRVNYCMKQVDTSDKSSKILDLALTKSEEAEKTLENMISLLENEEEITEAYDLTMAFSKKADLNKYVAQQVSRMIKAKANYLAVDYKEISKDFNDKISKSVAQAAVVPNNLMTKRHKRLIMIDTPVAEAIVSVEDTDKNRRINNLEKIFKRHGCKLISSYVNENKKGDRYCYYFSGKKYVIDALLGHFDGSVVNSDLKAAVKITTGGFWGGKKNYTFYVGPKRANKNIMGELSWYKSTIEHNPIAYFAEKNYDELITIGSTEKVAGVNKILFKNVKAEIWVFAGDKTEEDSIYHNKLELGDIYIDAK